MSRNAWNSPIVEVPRVDVPVVAADGRARAAVAPNLRSRWLRFVIAAASIVVVVVGLILLHGADPATHAARVGPTTGVLSVVSLAATLAYLAIMATLHVLPTGYSPVRHAVSDYAVGRYRSLFTTGLYVSSAAVLALAFALLSGIGTPPLATRAVAYLLLIPLARVGMTLFPTDLEGQRVSRTGLLHYACAIAAFTLTYLAISDMTPALRLLDTRGWTSAPLHWAAWMVGPALALVVVTMFRPLRRIFGLFERIFLLTTNVWFALVAVLLIIRLG
jgi:uncharacterized protein DUF998